jgi:hypothetical protein
MNASHASRLTFLFILALPFAGWAQDAIPPQQLDYFETHIRPNLIKYCYECHSVEGGESKGGLYLDTREGMRDGGSSGALLDDANWEHSLFIDAITWADEDYEMPPKDKLPDAVVAYFKKWAEMGAPDPRERKTFVVESNIDIEAGKAHWAYQKPRQPAERSIDEIVVKSRQAQGLKSVGDADLFSLLRRLTFDLTGLPPTPAEIKAFVAAAKTDRAAAITQKVDELMASDHYGERWGRHWLDVVRYGESSGTLNIIYPYAWRFRNYVIDAFNADKPYDRLITEHLAGDLLPAKTDAERQELLIATGYLAVGPKKQNEKNRQVFAMNLIDEQIDTTTRGFLGTTVACARCHDHKFDPIPTSDYYAMAGIFKSTETLWGTIAGNQNHRVSELMKLPIADVHVDVEDERKRYQETKARLEELTARNKSLRAQRRAGKSLEELGLSEQRDLVRLKQQIMRASSELKFLNPDGTSSTFGMGAREGEISDTKVLVVGDINKPAQVVERGFPQVLDFAGTPKIPEGTSGRLQLAQWITSKNNPLTARVMVNRIWMHLTGAPIVETMDNFGSTGLPPSNAKLLDYLAVRFMESDWSIKTLVREIVLSDTYQLASTYSAANYAKDPANKTHWRATPRQLDAESLRDQMFVMSGELDRERPIGSMAQASGDSRIKGAGGRKDASAAFNTAQFKKRSLYLPVLRDALPDELGLFDFPDPQGTIGQRSSTNVAPQSLHLMNSELVQLQTRALAGRLQERFPSLREQIYVAYLYSYSRPPREEEVTRALQFVSEFDPGDPPAPEPGPAAAPQGRRRGMASDDGESMRGRRGRRGQTAAAATAVRQDPIPLEQAKLAAFCQALMMSAEFRMTH